MMCEDYISTPKVRAKHLIWTKVMDSCLLKVLVENVKDDYKGENIIKTATYAAAVEVLNKRFGHDLNKDHVKNRLKTLKRKYSVLREILSQKGFKWDSAEKMVVANEAAWKKYIKVNADARHFRTKSFENYDELGTIFGTDKVFDTCSYIDSEDSLDVADNKLETSFNVDSDSDEKPKKFMWTEEMDTCLGNVLAEQVRKGYKLGNTLHTAAYEAAVEILNTEFGLGISKGHIKNRLKTWKKQYGVLNGLLSHGGFKWDETQRMVVGDDSLWTEYIQRNPEAKSLRGKCIENYSAMHTVVGKRHTIAPCSPLNTAAAGLTYVTSNEEQHVTAAVPDLVQEVSTGNTCDDTHFSPLPSPTKQSFNKKRCSCDRMAEMMREVASKIGRIADAMSGNCLSVCLDEVFEMVKRIPGFDDDMIIDACEFLSFDEKRTKMFINLDDRLRKQWLVKRLRSNYC